MQSKPASFLGRAILAVVLTVGFYCLALGVAGLLLLLVYAQAMTNHFNIQLTLICLVAAGTILYSILPRAEHFEDPGPRLEAEQQLRLLNEIQQIAVQTGQEMPARVYLVGGVNAFVAEVGGFLGMGRQRVMGIGLPLLSTLTVSQLRAVMAHEFGHFYTGDTRLGPWIYQTRTTILRTIQQLGKRSIGGRALGGQALFVWYGKLFLRFTHAVSRRQEFAADELSARLVGARPAIEGLRSIPGVTSAYQAYFQNEVFPVFSAGYHPPLVEGFTRFIHVERIVAGMQRVLDDTLQNEKPDLYDTHPTLKQRISALEALPAAAAAQNDLPAFSLLAYDLELERQLMDFMFDREKIRDLKPIAWQDVAALVFIPAWRKEVSQYQSSLVGLTPLNLPEFRAAPNHLAEQIQKAANAQLSPEDLTSRIDYVVGTALAVALIDAGWNLSNEVGEDVHLTYEGMDIQPFGALKKMGADDAAAESWRAVCVQAGIANLNLAAHPA